MRLKDSANYRTGVGSKISKSERSHCESIRPIRWGISELKSSGHQQVSHGIVPPISRCTPGAIFRTWIDGEKLEPTRISLRQTGPSDRSWSRVGSG